MQSRGPSNRSTRTDFFCAAIARWSEQGKSEIANAREFCRSYYLNDGWLVPRTQSDALLRDPKEARERRAADVAEGKVRSVEAATSRYA